jgi:Trk K+ transport system NAD-binding subunit
MIGKPLKDIKFPPEVLVALVERDSDTFTPHGNTELQVNDVLTIIGEPRSIAQLFKRYVSNA